MTTVKVKASNSTSVSFDITLVLVKGESSFIVIESSTATGASFTEFTVMVKVPVLSVSEPSETL